MIAMTIMITEHHHIFSWSNYVKNHNFWMVKDRHAVGEKVLLDGTVLSGVSLPQGYPPTSVWSSEPQRVVGVVGVVVLGWHHWYHWLVYVSIYMLIYVSIC